MKKHLSDKTFNLIFSVVSVAVMWLCWIVAYYVQANDYVIPSVGDTLSVLWRLLGESSFWKSFGNTLLRAVEAFAISFLLAAVCACLSALSRVFARILQPIVTVLRTVPTMAVIIIILLWTTPRIAPVIVGCLVTFPMVYAQMNAAFTGIDKNLAEVAKVYNFTPSQKVFKMYLPLMLPNVLSQAGAAFSLTLKIIVSAEVMARTYVSIGGMMQEARNYLEIPELFALTIVTIIAGALAEILLSLPVKLTDKWTKGKGGRA
ncbi:MAG: ABC transporter permease subunit [Clostridia bacterium]|nr:ABC transporter permease subunit [Clostridia bacterium]